MGGDGIHLKEAFNQEVAEINTGLQERLKPIRENFRRINSITNWTSIEVEDVWETTEGGEAKYYYQKEQLEKIALRHYGETFQLWSEYFLYDNELSFVYEKLLKYNRPFYYDSIAMKENNDTEAFDFDKSTIFEVRNYFENGKLIHQICGDGDYSPFSSDAESRLKSEFVGLIQSRH